MHLNKKITQNIPFISVLASSFVTIKQKKALLKLATNEQLLCIYEIMLNILTGTFSISTKEKKSLRTHKNFIIYISSKNKKKQDKRKKLIKQSNQLFAVLQIFLKKIKK